MQISDRTKDVIKSGGEWISSVELENEVMAHPGVVEAAVIAVPDERWSERPLVAVVLEDGADHSPDELLAFLDGRVCRWWLPERWAFIEEVPEDQCGQVRQEGPAGPVRRRRHSRSSRSSRRPAADRWPPIRPTSPNGCRESPRSSPTWPSTGCARPPTRVRAGGEPDPALTAEEKRITRARRSVEKAVDLLAGPGSSGSGLDEGP